MLATFFHPSITVCCEVSATAAFLPCGSSLEFRSTFDAGVECPFLLRSRRTHVSAAVLQPTSVSCRLIRTFARADPLCPGPKRSSAFEARREVPFQFDGLHVSAAFV